MVFHRKIGIALLALCLSFVSAEAFSGALVKKASDQTSADYTTPAAIAFDNETYDTTSWHDNSTQNTRMTAPNGATFCRIFYQIGLSGYSADFTVVEVKKNGSSLTSPGAMFTKQSISSGSTQVQQGVTPILPCASGDYFEVFLDLATDNSVTVVANQTYFAIEEASQDGQSHQGALVYLSADGGSTDYTTAAVVPNWNAEVYDTCTCHDTGANQTRLVAPSGASWVRLTAQLQNEAITASNWREIRFRQDGTTTTFIHAIEANGTTINGQAWTPVLPVTGGSTYFEILLRVESDTATNVGGGATSNSWASIEQVN